jgi:tRNA dimethylallyltransferase
MRKTLLVLLGPTGVGKTELSLELAERFGSPIISSDSRQIYKGIPVGTAAPTSEQKERVTHYFVDMLELDEYYSASRFEEDVLSLLDKLFKEVDTVVVTGGSMMYIDAITKGIDDMPTVSAEIRKQVYDEYEQHGLEPILAELKERDPKHYEEVDKNNYKRVIHALEICRQTGKPYSDYRSNKVKERPFDIVKIGLTREREELYSRINARVDDMMNNGLLEEAKTVYSKRHLNSLNTVGYKELFAYFDGQWDLATAVEKIKRNSRVYARKQMTWFKRDGEIRWFNPDDKDEIFGYLKSIDLL